MIQLILSITKKIGRNWVKPDCITQALIPTAQLSEALECATQSEVAELRKYFFFQYSFLNETVN